MLKSVREFFWSHHVSTAKNRLEIVSHGGSGTYRGHPLTNQGLLLKFFDFLIAEVFLHEIYRAAKI